MNRKEIIQRLEKAGIPFSKKSNTQKLQRKLEKNQKTVGVKAFRLLDNDKLVTGGIGGSEYTEFEEGKTYSIDNDEPIKLCKNGFHFYRAKDACFGAELFEEKTVLHKIIAYGEIVSDAEKCAARKIEVCERIELELDNNNNSGYCNSGNRNSGNCNSGNCNSGYRNTGDRNSGDYNSGNNNQGHHNTGHYNSGYRNSGNYNSGYQNTGHCNSGHRNTGNRNSGNRNSGDWNSCNGESGFLNTTESEFIRVFNKPCKREEWEKASIPNFFYFDLQENMTYKENWQMAWDKAEEEEKRLIEKLPNFDWKVFTELTGIEKPKDWDR